MKKSTTTLKISANEVPLNEALKILHLCFGTEQSFSQRITPILLGKPGNGKTSLVSQFAKEVNEKREPGSPEWEVCSFRLNQVDPTDLKGVPIPEDNGSGRSIVKFTPSDNLPLLGYPDSARGKNIILFFDELPQATPVIQNLAANMIDGVVGDYSLDPKRTFIVAAGNRKQDFAATFDIPKNVVSRICWIDVATSFSEWKDWAINGGLNPDILGFLEERPSFFNQDPQQDVVCYGTPRTWHKVSDIFTYYTSVNPNWKIDPKGESSYVLETTIAGLLGPGIAKELVNFSRTLAKEYSITDIIEGKSVPIVNQPDQAFSLILQACYIIGGILEKATNKVANEKGYTNYQELKSSMTISSYALAELVNDNLKEDSKKIQNLFAYFEATGKVEYLTLLFKNLPKTCGPLLTSLATGTKSESWIKIREFLKKYAAIRSRLEKEVSSVS
jgi:hypothetical protein